VLGEWGIYKFSTTAASGGTLPLRWMGLLAVAAEFVGAIVLGSNVARTISNDVLNVDQFEGQYDTLMVRGNVHT
jgi:phosphate/sulfate permease